MFLVFLLAVFLRLGGIPHQEPILFHPDEPEFVVRALRIAASGNLNPGWFAHPGTLTLYNLSLVYVLDAGLRDAPLKDLLAEYGRDPTPFHVLGKYVTVFWSMVEHLGLWLLARQFVRRWPALLAVFLLAVSRLDITLATLVRTDTQQSAILLLSCLLAVRGVKSARVGWFVGAGLLLGAATAVKWPSVAASPAIALAALVGAGKESVWPPTRKRLGLVAAAAGASLLGLFLATPYAFFDFGTVLDNVAHEARSRDLGPSHAGMFEALGFYFGVLYDNGSLFGCLLAALGAVLCLRSPSERGKYAVVLCFFVVYLLFICLQSVHWSRWAVPLVPLLCLMVAVGMVRALELLRARMSRPLLVAAAGGLFALSLAFPALASLGELLSTRAQGDPSAAATRWIAANVPAGSKVLSERAAPYLPLGLFELYVVQEGKGKLERVKTRARYYAPVGQVGYLKDADAALEAVDYVILGNYHSRLKQKPEGHERELKVYSKILRGSKTAFKRGSYRVLEVKKDER